jgi:hypothetical protein
MRITDTLVNINAAGVRLIFFSTLDTTPIDTCCSAITPISLVADLVIEIQITE